VWSFKSSFLREPGTNPATAMRSDGCERQIELTIIGL